MKKARKIRSLTENRDALFNVLEDEILDIQQWLSRHSVLRESGLMEFNDRLEGLLDIIREIGPGYVTNSLEEGIYNHLDEIDDMLHRVPAEMGREDIDHYVRMMDQMITFISRNT